ncbi:MAG TPA: hypothetical protein ENN03_07635 [bacterium]|nr:hypothetical protein [bacterium]
MKNWISICLLGISFVLTGTAAGVERVEETYRAKEGKVLEIFLDVDAGEVWVKRCADDREGRLFMEFTRDEFRPVFDFNEDRGRLRVALKKGSWTRFRRNGKDQKAKVTLEIPAGVDVMMDSRIKAGEVNMRMGGIRLLEFSLTVWAGEVKVSFDEPNPVTMSRLYLKARVGESRFLSLGNARFERADISGGIGELEADFSGALEEECRARVNLNIGESHVILPVNTGIQMKIGGMGFLSQKSIDPFLYERGGIYYNDDYDEKTGRFYIRISPGLGALRVTAAE